MYQVVEWNSNGTEVARMEPLYNDSAFADELYGRPLDPTHTRALYEDGDRVKVRGGLWGTT